MTTIETVPVTTEPIMPDTVVQAEPTTEQDEIVVEPVTDDNEPPIPKRKPGRPTGSKSKVPGKPRAPRQKKVVIADVPEEIPADIPEDDEIERVLPHSKPIPTHGYDDRTIMMITMLQQQADERKNRKAALYKSWFT